MRITKKLLETRIEHLNQILRGVPTPKGYLGEDASERAYHYVLECSNGGYKLNRFTSSGYGETDISYYSMSARELYYVVNSMVNMLENEIQNSPFNPKGLTMLRLEKGLRL